MAASGLHKINTMPESEKPKARREVLESVVKPQKTLYERLGGAPAVDAAVDQFYDAVLADERVNSFFAGTDMKKQRRMQKAFLTFAFGGPGSYSGRNMRKAHQKLVDEQGLNDTHYDVIVELLGGTLQKLGVCDADVAEAAKIANSVRDDVLCKELAAETKTLYERLGGAPAVDAAVDQFYDAVLADERVNSFFVGTDMKKQRRMQKAFLTFAFGGPGSYSGRNMRKAHQKLVDEQGLNDTHYDVIVELLGGTLQKLGVCDADVDEAAKIANSVRDDVLCREPKVAGGVMKIVVPGALVCGSLFASSKIENKASAGAIVLVGGLTAAAAYMKL